jgi:hypothetical protein
MPAPPDPRSLLAVALLALLLAATPVVADAASSLTEPGVDTQTDPVASLVALDNTTNQATPENVSRSEFGAADVDVAGAVGIGATRLHGRHDELTFVERLDSAAEGTAQLGVVRATIATVDSRTSTLDDRQARLFRAYSDGSLSTETFLRRFARIDAAATQQSALVDQIGTRATATPGLSLPVAVEKDLANLRARLVLLPSPITDRLAAGISGQAGTQTVYIEGAEEGLVLATADSTYRREATLRSNWAPDRDDQFTSDDGPRITAAYRFAGTLYPWLFGNAIGDPSIRGFGDTTVYLIEGDHPQGEIWTYLDGATRSVFRERQTKRPEVAPVTGTTTSTADDLAVRVETTEETGPMRVTVTRPDVDTPVDAEIAVDGHRVGRTGDDGQLWTVEPTPPARVNVTTGESDVTVLVR